MMHSIPAPLTRRTWPQSLPFYYGWVNVVLASLAMTATLPCRTHGLGLITEPLLLDLGRDQVWFGRINLVATLVGAGLCIPIGWLIDRLGVRRVVVAVVATLGLSVLGMSAVEHPAKLLPWLILVRGFGQSALSVVSMAMIGKWFGRRLGIAMGAFAALLTLGFIGSVLGMGAAVQEWGWRDAWHGLGLVVLGLAPLFWTLARSTPETCGLHADAPAMSEPAIDGATRNLSLRDAVCTPAFWNVVLGSSLFNLVWSGVTLFNESLLAERGVDKAGSVEIMAILTGAGLIASLACAKFATRAYVVRLLGVGLVLLAGALAAFPSIAGLAGARWYAVTIGLSGGIITVVFFAAWGNLFGRAHLGRIQGAAQLATVLASALGPDLMAESRAWTGSIAPTFYGLAAVTSVLAFAALLTHSKSATTIAA